MLQDSVSDLEMRVYRYQQESSKETTKTTSSLSEVNESINTAFQEIRYAQSNLENLMNQLSGRVAGVERRVEQLGERMNRLDTNSSENYSVLTDNINLVREQSKEELSHELANLKAEMRKIASDLSGLREQSAQNRGAMESRLNARITQLESNTQAVYERILKEMGIASPVKNTSSTSSEQESYTGTVHIVSSGDTLSNIAAKYQVSMRAIQELNGIDDPSRIILGQRIRIPSR
jgi:LysM repeat protein